MGVGGGAVKLTMPAPTVGVPGTKVFEIVYGSHAHGTATPTSDIDVRGVYLLPDNDFLGIGRPKTTWENKVADVVFWELGHFCSLLLKGNPNIVGMLFAPDDCTIITTPQFAGLRQLRSSFLSQSMVNAYMGWVHRELADIGKLKNGHAKRLSHIPRLIWEIESVLRDGLLTVRPDGRKVDTIVAIKTGAMDYDDAVNYCGNLLLELEDMFDHTEPLPEPPVEETNDWLLETRRLYGGRR